MPEDNELSRPQVQVKLPEVRLRLEDLSYLRSLTQPKSVRCHPGSKSLQRLRFLDLIARAKIPPDKETLVKTQKKLAETKREMDRAYAKRDWGIVSTLSYNLKHDAAGLDPLEDDVLTEKGRQLLQVGEVKVRVRKVGCAT